MITREAMLRVFLTAITIICLRLAGVSGVNIIDGTVAVPHSRPYIAFLIITKERQLEMCGGFLIYPNVILTAAHCKGKAITVILGAHYHSKNEKSQQRIPVQKMITHEAYNDMTLENDIMILKLQFNATITKEVKTIRLPSEDDHFGPGTTCLVAGWGLTSFPGNSSNVLREVAVKIKEHCNSASEICARGIDKKGTCYGDSGGPLVCPGRNNIPTAVGIVSYMNRENCEDSHGSDMYVNVPAYLKWIKSKIGVSCSG
ncbi:mast cell protease 1-like isoform X2 [Erpetoichthys calabaricus]|uniref:mast cell protease 1-like isoform X2 n=1 Tax=Erpetoichthys calabaricus TaxID=27687 RepID=UPI002233FFE2|nr:mast cell protease 1-like isoform X2 [Erpetoichthys calabaricus]